MVINHSLCFFLSLLVLGNFSEVCFFCLTLSNCNAQMLELILYLHVEGHTVQFLMVLCNKKLCMDKWHEILIGTLRQVRNAKKFEIPTTEI